MSLPLRPLLAAAVVLAAPAAAHAEKTLADGEELIAEIAIPDGDNPLDADVVSEGAAGYPLEKRFSLGRCLCSVAGANDPERKFQFAGKFDVDPDPTQQYEGTVLIFTGTGCDGPDMTSRIANCGEDPLDTLPDINQLPQGRFYPVHELISPTENTCPTDLENDRALYAFIDKEADGQFEMDDIGSMPIKVDTKAPPLPSAVTAAGAEGAISLNWDLPDERSTDIAAWQVFCATSDGDGGWTAPPGAPTDEPEYESSAILCGQPYAITVESLPVTDPPDVDAGTPSVEVPRAFADLDPSYICATARQTDTSIRIEGLTNGTPYIVMLVAIDKAGNAAAGMINATLTPKPATDFWEELNDGDDEVDGGYCLIASTYGDGGGLTGALRAFRDQTLATTAPGRLLIDAYYKVGAPIAALAQGSIVARVVLGVLLLPLVAIALLWHVLTLPGLIALVLAFVWLRRARKLRAAAPALAGAAVLLLAGPASAQQSWTPYWDDETQLEESGPEDVKWHVGIKLGPYVPEIDDMFDGRTPFADTFPDKFVPMPVLEIDRFFLHPGGQLGVGGSIGYFGRKASAFLAEDPTPRDGVRDRSSGDKTTFRMLPLALNVVYRWTAGDDDWGVPLVPYVRGGLAYYLWRITAPSGDTATAPIDPDCMPETESCVTTDGRGGSLGVQGSIGLAIRAERIDATAAASMRESGMYHAGFYVEYQLAWVNDFGKGNKLSVGDDTWYAGIDFEF